MQKQSSRSWVLDAIEALINLIALASHSQELLNTLVYDYSLEVNTSKKKEIEDQIHMQYQILNDSVDMRRDLTSQIKSEFDCNEKMWCSFKHAIAQYWYATELMYAYKDSEHKPFYENYQQRAYELCMGIVWLFLWLDEIVPCARCVNEILEQKKVEWLKSVQQLLVNNNQANESTTIQTS